MSPLENGKIKGTVSFTQTDRGLQVTADLDGLEPNSRVALEVGDLSSGTGGKFNAVSQGNLGELVADANGHVHFERVVEGVSLGGGDGIVGRSVVVHETSAGSAPMASGSIGAGEKTTR